MAPKTTAPTLELRNLSITVEEHSTQYTAVDDLSFSIGKGETVAMVGESGSGKSLTAFGIMQLLPRTAQISAGEVLFNGENLAEVIRIHRGVSRHIAKEQVLALLEMVGIPDPRRRYRTYSHQLSGGMRQRILIAMALACRPDLIIADEPATAVDPTVQAQILDLIARLGRDLKMSVLLITHDLEMVDVLADRVLVIHAGRLIEEGPAKNILKNPAHPYTKELLATRLSAAQSPERTRLMGSKAASKHRSVASMCAFAGPCPLTKEICRVQKPQLTTLTAEHRVRCCVMDNNHDRSDD